jgi:hypothetical protein
MEHFGRVILAALAAIGRGYALWWVIWLFAIF